MLPQAKDILWKGIIEDLFAEAEKSPEDLLGLSLDLSKRLFRKGFSKKKINSLLDFIRSYVFLFYSRPRSFGGFFLWPVPGLFFAMLALPGKARGSGRPGFTGRKGENAGAGKIWP
jgi:hypothetical protein